MRTFILRVSQALFLLLVPLMLPAEAQTVRWIRQFGTPAFEYVLGVAIDPFGDVYVVGGVEDALPGQTYTGVSRDAFIRKYDASGIELWTRQFGSSDKPPIPEADSAYAVFANDSGVYVAGRVGGTLPGQTSSGGYDAFIRLYDTNGTEVWTRQFGTSEQDDVLSVFANGSYVYVVGGTLGTLPGQTNAGALDGFIRKYDASGNEVWTRQHGTTGDDYVAGLFVDQFGVYVGGITTGAMPGQSSTGGADAYVRRYDLDGNEIWTRQFGSDGDDAGYGVGGDGSAIYIVGTTYGSLPGQTNIGGSDAFIRRYDSSGNVLWTRQFGTSCGDGLRTGGVFTDGAALYVSGYTGASCGPMLEDAFVSKYSIDGSELWTVPFATGGLEVAEGIAVAGGEIYVAGWTTAAFPGQTHLGSFDAFVLKLTLEQPNTAAGTNVAVQPTDVTTGTTPVHVTFSNVTQAGWTDLMISGSGPALPNGFSLGQPATYYELTTLSIFTGPVVVCVNYTAFADDSGLQLWHFEEGQWIDRTTSLDVTSHTICGTVTSLSPFAVVGSSRVDLQACKLEYSIVSPK